MSPRGRKEKNGKNFSNKSGGKPALDVTSSLLNIQDFSQSGERNYSCSNLISLDPIMMALINPGANFVDSAKKVLVGHSFDILTQVAGRSVLAHILGK